MEPLGTGAIRTLTVPKIVKHVLACHTGTCQHPNPNARLTKSSKSFSNAVLQLVLNSCCSKQRQPLLQTKENLMIRERKN